MDQRYNMTKARAKRISPSPSEFVPEDTFMHWLLVGYIEKGFDALAPVQIAHAHVPPVNSRKVLDAQHRAVKAGRLRQSRVSIANPGDRAFRPYTITAKGRKAVKR